MILPLSILVVADSEGDAFISINQGLQLSSINISYPYISKQCLSFIITDYTDLNV